MKRLIIIPFLLLYYHGLTQDLSAGLGTVKDTVFSSNGTDAIIDRDLKLTMFPTNPTVRDKTTGFFIEDTSLYFYDTLQHDFLKYNRVSTLEDFGADVSDGSDDAFALDSLNNTTPEGFISLAKGVINIKSNVAINRTIDFSQGGIFEIDSLITLTINVPFIAEDKLIFSGKGFVKINYSTPIQAAWWLKGDGISDESAGLQRAIDVCLFSDEIINKQIFVPAGTFNLSEPLNLGYGNAFRGLELIGAGMSFTSSGAFGGTKLKFTSNVGPCINVQGARISKIQGIFLEGLNDITRPVGYDMQDTSNWMNVSLPVTVGNRYSPYVGISVDAYSGVKPNDGYPDVNYPWYTGITTQYNKNFSSQVILTDVSIHNFFAGIVVQPCNADGNGDFVKVEACSIIDCVYGLSVGNSQARNTELNNCVVQAHTAVTTSKHGQRKGKVQNIQNSHFTGYQILNIINTPVNGPLTLNACYAEVLSRIGIIGTNASSNAGTYFTSCQFQFDGFNNDYVIDMLEIDHKATTWFNNCMFTGMKWYTIYNTDNANVFYNGCTFVANPSSCEPAGVDLSDLSYTKFFVHNAFTWGTFPQNIEIEASRTTSNNPNYSGQVQPFGNGTMLPNADPSYLTFWDNKNLKYLYDSDLYSLDIETRGPSRSFQPSGNSAVLNDRDLTFNLPASANFGFGVGSVLSLPQGYTFMIDSISGTTAFARLMNNYISDTNGNFVDYARGNPDLTQTGSLYSPNKLITPRILIGDFTAGSSAVTNLRFADDNTAFSGTIDDITPLYDLNRVVPESERYLPQPAYVVSAISASLTLSDNAIKSGTFPIIGVYTGNEIPSLTDPRLYWYNRSEGIGTDSLVFIKDKLSISNDALGGNTLNAFSAESGPIAVLQSNGANNGNDLLRLVLGNSVTGSVDAIRTLGSSSTTLTNVIQQSGDGKAEYIARVLGTGDAQTSYSINGGQNWSLGLDNSDNDKFKIASGTNLSLNTFFNLSNTGIIGFDAYDSSYSLAGTPTNMAWFDDATGEVKKSSLDSLEVALGTNLHYRYLMILDNTTDVSVGTFNVFYRIPSYLDGYKLNSIYYTVSTGGTGAGTNTIRLSIDGTVVSSYDSNFTTGTSVQTDGSTTVNEGEKITFEVTSLTGTAPKGFSVELEFIE